MLLLALAACGEQPPANVLLVTLDTVRADALGAYGGPPTPTLDRIAAEGWRFDNAYTVTPLTIPAHASILTGLLPYRHTVRDNGDARLPATADTLAERLKAQGYRTMASVGAEPTSRHWGFSQGFDAYFDDLGTGTKWAAERRADAVVRDTLAWLSTRRDAPWFAWVHLYDAHDPYRPPEPFATEHAEDPYAGEVAFVDAQVGALLDGLGDDLDRTWVIVVGDHGESRGEHGEAHHGVLLYDGATRVPFLIRPPGGGDVKVQSRPVSIVDVTPTILGALGLPVPPDLDGRDVRVEPPDGRPVYIESLYAWRHFGWAPQRAVVTPEHALLDSTTPELYRAGDRAQSTPLSDPAAIERLRGVLAGFVGAPLEAEAPSSSEVGRLEALGYLTGESASGRDASGNPLENLPDPVARLPVLARVEEVRAAYRAGDLPRARALAQEVVDADPGLEEGWLLLATLQWRAGDLPSAVATVQALDARRKSSQSQHLLGLLALAQGHTREGADLLAEAVRLDPSARSATETWLQTLLVLEDLPALAAGATLAHENLPHSPIVTGMAGVSRALQGDAAGARPLLESAIRDQPDQPFVHHALGITLRDLGDTAGARAAFKEEIRRYPPASPSRAALDTLR